MPVFYVGQDYTRRQISGRIGGSMQDALPLVGTVVVAACLHADSAHNPDAPEVILCGNGPRASCAGERLAGQSEPIHAFAFLEPNRWEYRGLYSVVATFTHGREFDKWASHSTRPASDISRVIRMKREPEA